MPSTATCFDTDCVLMLHMDDTGLTDSSASGKAITLNGGAARSSTESKFGGFSAYFDGTGDYLSTPDSADWDFGTGDFTIESWVRFDDFVHNNHAIAGNGWNANGWMFNPYLEGTFYLFFNGLALISGTPTYSPATWYHVAVIRSGTTLAIYQDGVQLNSVANTTNMTGGTNNLDIGDDAVYHDTGALKGYLDEFRIVKGTAVWTANFTPPSAAYVPCGGGVQGDVETYSCCIS